MTTLWGRIVASAVAIGLVAAAITVVASSGPRQDRSSPQRSVPASLLRASSPSSPRSPKASGGNGRATVRWTAPLHTNGSPVNAYLVWPYLGHTQLKAREFHSKKTSEVVTGLSNDHQYTFRVAARNAVGIGPKSSASSAVWVRTLSGYWRPSSAAPISWNWQLQTPPPIPTNTKVQVFDVDGFETSAATVAALHAQGTKVICYIDFGTSENFRPDFGSFPTSVQGAYNGWPGERWLDIRQLSVLEPIMTKRMQMCVQKGFDALEPDNIDGYENDTGFPLTAQDQLTYNTWIANTA
ncbi:MAG: endo alpha-1,4 polygalactosaminidase, partial [Acidimicrobiia bacterium]